MANTVQSNSAVPVVNTDVRKSWASIVGKEESDEQIVTDLVNAENSMSLYPGKKYETNRGKRIKLFKVYGPRWYRYVNNTEDDNNDAKILRELEKCDTDKIQEYTNEELVDWMITYNIYGWHYSKEDMTPYMNINHFESMFKMIDKLDVMNQV